MNEDIAQDLRKKDDSLANALPRMSSSNRGKSFQRSSETRLKKEERTTVQSQSSSPRPDIAKVSLERKVRFADNLEELYSILGCTTVDIRNPERIKMRPYNDENTTFKLLHPRTPPHSSHRIRSQTIHRKVSQHLAAQPTVPGKKSVPLQIAVPSTTASHFETHSKEDIEPSKHHYVRLPVRKYLSIRKVPIKRRNGDETTKNQIRNGS